MRQDSKVKSPVQNLYFQPLGLLKIVKNYHDELLLCQIALDLKRTWGVISVRQPNDVVSCKSLFVFELAFKAANVTGNFCTNAIYFVLVLSPKSFLL